MRDADAADGDGQAAGRYQMPYIKNQPEDAGMIR